MKIDINSGGLFQGTDVHDLMDNYEKLLRKNREVTRMFKIVRSRIDTMNGGVGNLRTGYDELSARISRTQYQREQKIRRDGERIITFLENTQKTDKAVAAKIGLVNTEFAVKNPWSVEKSLKEKALGLWNSSWDFLTKWPKAERFMRSAARFMRNHAVAIKKILVGLAVIAAIAAAIALIVLSGGTAAPLLVAALKGAIVFGLIGAAGSAVVSAAVHDKSGAEVFEDAADGFMKGTFAGAAWGVMSVAGAAGGAAITSKLTASGLEAGAAKLGSGILSGVAGFFGKTVGYTVANVAAEGAGYFVSGKGFGEGFVWQTIGKSAFMAGGDTLGKFAGEIFTFGTGKALPFAALEPNTWGGATAGMLMPSTGSVISGYIVDNPGDGFLGKTGYAVANQFGNTAAAGSANATPTPRPDYFNLSGYDFSGAVKSPTIKLPQIAQNLSIIKQDISAEIGKRISYMGINFSGLVTKSRIDNHFSRFTSGSYAQCVIAGACY